MKTKINIKHLLIALTAILTTTTCTFDWDNPYDELGNNYSPELHASVDFKKDILPIFSDRNCTGCHGSMGGLDLSEQNAYKNILDGRVNLNYPEQSLIYTRPAGNHPVNYSEYEASLVLQWIEEGAKCPDCASGSSGNTVTDYDGNTYKTVVIGAQTWMAENLKVTHYPNGTEILLVTDNTAWGNLGDNDTDDAYCYYDNNSSSEYGALYTYAAAKDACPTGWHLPSDEEWKTLEMYLGMSQSDADDTGWRGTNEGTKLKATNGWNSNGNGTDDYGFAALPGGRRYYGFGSFGSAGNYGGWWSSTEYSSSSAYSRLLSYDYANVSRYHGDKSYGFSVRCTKD